MMDNHNYKVIKEGLAYFYVNEEDYNAVPSKSMSVFYNKKMLLNRDITSLAINAYFSIYKPPSLIVLDSMAASGIGAIRRREGGCRPQIGSLLRITGHPHL